MGSNQIETESFNTKDDAIQFISKSIRTMVNMDLEDGINIKTHGYNTINEMTTDIGRQLDKVDDEGFVILKIKNFENPDRNRYDTYVIYKV